MKHLLWVPVILLVFSCSKDDRPDIPYVRVYFSVDLQFKDKELTVPLAAKVFTIPRNSEESVGYSGLLVVYGIDGEYYVYDLCCPYDAQKNIRVTPANAGRAECLHCTSEFDISYGGGYPVSGPSKHTLVRYNVMRNGHELLIRH